MAFNRHNGDSLETLSGHSDNSLLSMFIRNEWPGGNGSPSLCPGLPITGPALRHLRGKVGRTDMAWLPAEAEAETKGWRGQRMELFGAC